MKIQQVVAAFQIFDSSGELVITLEDFRMEVDCDEVTRKTVWRVWSGGCMWSGRKVTRIAAPGYVIYQGTLDDGAPA